MARAEKWVCWAKIDALGGRPKPEKVRNPITGKMEKTGKMIEPIRAGANVSYIERRGETIGAGCNLPSLGENFCESYGTPFSPGERSRITRRFIGIEREESGVRWDSRVGYSVKMPVPNSIPVERIPDLAHDVISRVLDGKHEYAFSVHRGGISAKDRQEMDEKERDPITGQMRLTPHARALRKVLRGEDNRHVHFVFRERPLGEKTKDSVRWMQTKIHGVMSLRSCPEDPDGEREHYGFDDALGEVLANKFGFTIVKKKYDDPRPPRKRVGQKKYKARQKQKIRDIEKAENRKDMEEIVQNYQQDYQQLEEQKAGVNGKIIELDRTPETPVTQHQERQERLKKKMQTGKEKGTALADKSREMAKAKEEKDQRKQTPRQETTRQINDDHGPGRDR